MVSAPLWSTLLCAAAILNAQEPASPLALAKTLDQEISSLKNLPAAERASAIQGIAKRIRQQPSEYAVSLASNLAVDAVDGSAEETLLSVASTLADALQRSPRKPDDPAYTALAELIRYNQLPLSLADPNFAAAMQKLATNDKHREGLDFELMDLQGKRWQLKKLRGKVVLLNFWATWCPPCRAEVPDLAALQQRFGSKGLTILAVSEEDPATLQSFVASHQINYQVLLDPEGKIKDQFRVNGIPQTFIYNRKGKLIAYSPYRPSPTTLRKLLQRAGLR